MIRGGWRSKRTPAGSWPPTAAEACSRYLTVMSYTVMHGPCHVVDAAAATSKSSLIYCAPTGSRGRVGIEDRGASRVANVTGRTAVARCRECTDHA